MKQQQRFLNIIAALLALFIGVMSVFAGTSVLLGTATKDYNLLLWLVIYNVVVGILSIIVAYFIWKHLQISKRLIPLILGAHLLIFLYLNFLSETVASESIKAMLFRVVVWIVILILSILIPKYIIKKQV